MNKFCILYIGIFLINIYTYSMQQSSDQSPDYTSNGIRRFKLYHIFGKNRVDFYINKKQHEALEQALTELESLAKQPIKAKL